MTPSTTNVGSACVVGWLVSKQPPWSMEMSTSTAPALHRPQHGASHELRCGGTGNEHRADHEVGIAHQPLDRLRSSNTPSAGLRPKRSDSSRRRSSDRSTMVTSARMPTAISAACLPATPPPRITTFAGGTPGTPPSRHSEAAVSLLQARGAHLDGHAAGDFAHRRQQRQRAVRRSHGLVGNRGRTGLHQAWPARDPRPGAGT